MGKILRRSFLIGSTAIAGGVAFGYWAYKNPHPNPLQKSLTPDQTSLTPYVLIDQSGITIIAPRAEMGQGVHTTLAALVAEELDVALKDVNIIHGPASKAYYNAAILKEGISKPSTDVSKGAERQRAFMDIPAKFLGMQVTGGSTSIPDAYTKMRKAGAAARIALIKAAAKEWNEKPSTLKTANGHVIAPDGRTLSYQELAPLARSIKLPRNPALKPKSAWKILGKSQRRHDIVGKSTGTALYSMDVRLPDMVYATVKMNPHIDAGMKSFNADHARTMAGVQKIVALDNGIAVIANNSWNAFRAANEVDCDWEPAAYHTSSEEIEKSILNSFAADFKDSQFKDEGNVTKIFEETRSGENTLLEGTYKVPYLAHATMEPMNAVAHLRDGKLDIWVGTQLPTQVVKEAEAITKLKEKNITVHTTYMGGGFGRRAEMDFVIQAIKIAKIMEGTPVKLVWSREEDMRHDVYRPAAMAKFKAVTKDGKINAIDLQVSASSVVDSQMGRIGISIPGPDSTIAQSAWDQPYAIPNYRVTAYKAPIMLPVGSWRSVGASQNAFFQETMLDEIATAGGMDPIAMRLAMINHEPSYKVVETVSKLSNWDKPLPAGQARGMAFCLSFGVPVAQVIEIEQTPDGLKLAKIFAAVDVGTALDPANIRAQVKSAIIYGLSAAIMGEITIADGQVEQSNFHDYDAMRLYQVPAMEVAILENNPHIHGIGEPGLPPIAPALGNAIFALTGERIRALPMNKSITFI